MQTGLGVCAFVGMLKAPAGRRKHRKGSEMSPADRASSFATLVDCHMTHGTRPAGIRGIDGDPWTPQTLAPVIGCSERTVLNYRNGRTLPSDIRPIEPSSATTMPIRTGAKYSARPGAPRAARVTKAI